MFGTATPPMYCVSRLPRYVAATCITLFIRGQVKGRGNLDEPALDGISKHDFCKDHDALPRVKLRLHLLCHERLGLLVFI